MSKITHIKAGSNCYLIQQNGSAILVDTIRQLSLVERYTSFGVSFRQEDALA